MSLSPTAASPHHVVIIGSGFGGLFAARALKKAPVKVTLIAETTSHLFQPLLYQVATGILSEGEIAPSTRELLARQKNARVLLGTVTGIDAAARTVTSTVLGEDKVTPYDSLIVAAGAGQSYFGNDHFAEHAPGMKTIDDALELRGRIFGAFELAELAEDEAQRRRLLTFAVIGAGPTGVEMAGQIAELSRRTLKDNFRSFDPADARIVLLDAAPAVLGSFGDRLGGKAAKRLESMGVEIRLGAKVTDVDMDGLRFEDSSGSHRLETVTKVWAAGVQAAPLADTLAQATGATQDRAGRIQVRDDLTLPDHPEIFVVGDMASLDNYPGVAQVAIQGGEYAARTVVGRLEGQQPQGRFVYHDKGSMATIFRFSAVASIGSLRLSGFIAWVLWLVIHLLFMIGFKSRLTTLLHWAVSFLGRGRAERAATLQQVMARNLLVKTGAHAELNSSPRAAGE